MNPLKKYFASRIVRLIITATLVLLVAGGISYRITANSNQKIITGGGCEGLCVALTKKGMSPNEIAVKVGQYVQFNAADGERHNIAEGDGAENHRNWDDEHYHDHLGGLLSGEFGPDEAWRVQFKKAGTYTLHDHFHPNQNIVVVVYEENNTATIK